MSYLAPPLTTTIAASNTFPRKVWTYVAPQQGATGFDIDATANFEFSNKTFGEPCSFNYKYLGPFSANTQYYNITLRFHYAAGVADAVQNVQIVVVPGTSSSSIKNITTPARIQVGIGAWVDFEIATDYPLSAGYYSTNFNVISLPAGLAVTTWNDSVPNTHAKVTGTVSVDGFYVMKLVAASAIRYFVLVVGSGGGTGGGGGTGQGGGGGSGTPITAPSTGTSGRILFDGNYSSESIAGPPKYEIPFKNDPKPYAYSVPYWQIFENYSEPDIGTTGPFGGSFVGDVPGSIKSIGGGIYEFEREFATVPDTRSEYESFTYSYQFVFVGEQGGITEVPFTVQSRLQFDYFQTDAPLSIDLPKAPRAIQIMNIIYLIHGWFAYYTSPTGTEFLAEDAKLKIWKGNIYERQQRFIEWININDLGLLG
jgi:hypothetical protein